MPTTIENVKAADLSAILQKEYNIKPQQELKIIFEIKESSIKENNSSSEDYDCESVHDSVMQALKEVKAHREGKLELPDAFDVLNEL